MFYIVNGGPCDGQGSSVVGLFLRSKTPSDAGRDNPSSTALRILVVYNDGRGEGGGLLDVAGTVLLPW